MQYFNSSTNHLKAIKMFSSNHLMKNCYRNSLLTKSLTNNGFYSLHKRCLNHFFGSNSYQNRHKLLIEYKAVLRTLRNSNLSVLSSNDCFYKWIHSSHCYNNNNQNKDPKNGSNNKNKSQTNSSHNNDNEDNKEDDEPKSSLLAKAAIWMLTGFVTSHDLL